MNWMKNLLNKFPIDFEHSNVSISGCSKNTFPSHLHCHHTTWMSVKNPQKVARFCVKTSYRSISRSSYNWMPKSISRKISGTKKIWIFHTHSVTLWKNEKFTLTKIFFRQINSLVIYLVNALVSRNFCQKSVRVNFRNFHSVLSSTIFLAKISWK